MFIQVSTVQGMEEALGKQDWDVVCCNILPNFDVRQALELARRKRFGLPFIVVADEKDEPAALDLMEAGAHDYVTKNSLPRLVLAVKRELKVVEAREEREQTEERLRESIDALIAIYEASQLLNSSLESEEICTQLLKIMQRVSDLMTAVISKPDGHGNLRVWRAIGFENLWSKVRYVPEARDALREVMESGEHRLLRLQHPDRTGQKLSALYLPLRTRVKTFGVLEVYASRNLVNSDIVEREILISLANKAANALENAELYEALAERESQLQELVGKLLATQERERRRIAYEVHDGPTQLAIATYQHLQAFARDHPFASREGLDHLQRTIELARRTVGESRQIIANLRPTTLDDFGLVAAVRQEVDSLRAEGYRTSYEENLGDRRIPDPIETALYRVAQEALTNVRKHAGATPVRVKLSSSAKTIRLWVRDWGKGFSSALSPGKSSGERVGVAGMHERMALLDGELRVYSKRGEGTLIVARVSLDGLDEDSDNLALEQKLVRFGRTS